MAGALADNHATSVPRPRAGPRPMPPPDPVQHHYCTLWIVIFYLPLLVIPWVVTCVLDIKPVTRAGSSYVAVRGDYTPSDLSAVDQWMRAISVLNAAAAVLTVPVVSAVLGHATVVFIQRRRSAQSLNAWDMLSLADARWLRLDRGRMRKTWLAMAGFSLMLVSILLFPLQYSLVAPQQLQVASCLDVPVFNNSAKVCATGQGNYYVGNYDPEPADMARAPAGAIVRRVASQLSMVNEEERQSHIWADVQTPGDLSSHTNQFANDDGLLSTALDPTVGNPALPFFVSALPTGFTTGVLREHAMRSNSSVSCKSVSASAFPSVCPGSRPFNGTYRGPSSTFRWCAPGAYDVYPWTNSRDRQDITEEVYIDGLIQAGSALWQLQTVQENGLNFTLHCMANTTRGYFELGSYYNDNTPGPLLETWPSQDDLNANFNDALSFLDGFATPATNDTGPQEILSWPAVPDPFNDYSLATPGPLMTALLAMLGNESWFAPIANVSASAPNDTALLTAALTQACMRGTPLSSFPVGGASLLTGAGAFSLAGAYCNDLARRLTLGAAEATEQVVALWFMAFPTPINDDSSSEPPTAAMALGVGMYFAEEALLVEAAAAAGVGAGRPIFVAGGTAVIKPNVPLYAKVIVSAFMFAEVAGLIALLAFIYSSLSFASRIDAATLASIGAQLTRAGAKLPTIGAVDAAAIKRLEEMDGLIGAYGTDDPVELMPYGAGDGAADADADAASSRTASVELAPQRVGPGSVGGVVWPGSTYKLSIGAQGLISRGFHKRYRRQAVGGAQA